MLSLKNVKSPDSNFVNFPKVGAYGIFPLQAKTFRFPWEERWMFVRLRIYAGSACYSCANCPIPLPVPSPLCAAEESKYS